MFLFDENAFRFLRHRALSLVGPPRLLGLFYFYLPVLNQHAIHFSFAPVSHAVDSWLRFGEHYHALPLLICTCA